MLNTTMREMASLPSTPLSCHFSWNAAVVDEPDTLQRDAHLPRNSLGEVNLQMHSTKTAVSALLLLLIPVTAFSKGKSKPTMPPYVLTAHTVSVIIDPGAGESVTDPRANQIAQKDVETALLKWGRFEPLIGTQAADLIIVIRKGHGKLVDQTIPDSRQNNRTGVINPTDNGISVGAQRGHQPGMPDPSMNPGTSLPSQTEISNGDDSFTVYDGKADQPLDGAPAWKLVAKDCLHSHDVPAVDEFRKAVAEAEKAAGKKP